MKFILLFSLFITILFAAPAYNKLREFKQADGTTFMAKGQGNQHLNWIETQDGKILRYNQTSKNFDYAEIREESLEASGTRYKKENFKKAKSLQEQKNSLKQSVYDLWAKKNKKAQQRRHKRN